MAELTNAEIAAELRRINRWRRGDEDIEQPDPTQFGRLLDLAAKRLEAADHFVDAGKMVGKRGHKSEKMAPSSASKTSKQLIIN